MINLFRIAIVYFMMTNMVSEGSLDCDCCHKTCRKGYRGKGLGSLKERRESISLTLLDLSKAFDDVSHTILLEKLACYGAGGVVLQTLEFYLADREQVVVVGGASSGKLLVKDGVSHVLTLGSLLFLLVMNGLRGGDDALLYAHDIIVMRGGATKHELEEAAVGDLLSVEHWFEINRLQVNVEKTQSMICTVVIHSLLS